MGCGASKGSKADVRTLDPVAPAPPSNPGKGGDPCGGGNATRVSLAQVPAKAPGQDEFWSWGIISPHCDADVRQCHSREGDRAQLLHGVGPRDGDEHELQLQGPHRCVFLCENELFW